MINVLFIMYVSHKREEGEEMERKIVGRFYGIRFDELIYGFIVYADGKIVCPNVSKDEYDRIYLKPRFELIGKKSFMHSNADHNKIDGLVREYVIEPELFEYMIENDIIRYSVDMAQYYGFDSKYAFDKEYNPRPFKRAGKKGKVLIKQKQGLFN